MARMRLVLGAMAEEGYITPQQARTLRAPRIDGRDRRDLPTGTYFADWALPEARKLSDVGYARQTIRTTLDSRLQAAARSDARRVGQECVSTGRSRWAP